ncbi:uncharacterized beta-barrel protein YwiB (DUF1934 family) [Herbinix hemicellulosilytica]|uniref:DUF1934 domain-containing protein n=1 Tax=Herbinix hemicellulosilytica TaxID=1564487 RepID=A0A0H5SJE1_HERHM|nr:DUF1934 domain-containing protein [Herbinix hemicellulosilytica]RBP58685.1 uncharacterized beta-barrel protein YwiB (DUF1934 family) [Herbinix hemicellulosilytica]CRZ35609.1 hypothetical protein HHT355_2423 [Herbinix hemicellulosilytica]
MKGKVNVFIEGKTRENNGSIITDVTGEYRFFNGKHIIRYKEYDKENTGESDNTIKVLPGLVEMIKKGDNRTHMVFDLSKDTHTFYNTPYGSFMFQICTKRIEIEENEKELIVDMEYALFQNNEHFSDNQIRIAVREI